LTQQHPRRNNPIQPLWYIEAQRGLSTRPKTSLLTPLPTYLMTEAFLPHFNSQEIKWYVEFTFYVLVKK
jgi:hypothetical protein